MKINLFCNKISLFCWTFLRDIFSLFEIFSNESFLFIAIKTLASSFESPITSSTCAVVLKFSGSLHALQSHRQRSLTNPQHV